MKRLLSILASIGLVATASSAAVACGSNTIKPSTDGDGSTISPNAVIDTKETLITLMGTNIPSGLTANNFLVIFSNKEGYSEEWKIDKDKTSINTQYIILYLESHPNQDLKNKDNKLTVYFNFKGIPNKNSLNRPVKVDE